MIKTAEQINFEAGLGHYSFKENEATLAIPKFLQRNQTENTMQHTPEKKTRAPRQKIELPNTITIGLDADEYVKIDTLDIAQLVEHSKRINTILASVPRLELERRAIRRAIIQKA